MSKNIYYKVKEFFKSKDEANKSFKKTDRLIINKFQFRYELKKIPARNFRLSSTGKDLLLDLETRLQSYGEKSFNNKQL